jgi:exonuclease III
MHESVEGIDNTTADNPQEPSTSQRNKPTLNTTNLWTNEVYGNKLQLPKSPNISRFISLNINGFCQANEFQDASKIAHTLKISSADNFNFQETKLNLRSECQGHCYEIFRKVYHHIRMATSSSKVTYRMHYQPEGTMSIITDDYIGRVIETGRNIEMGRWSYQRLLEKHGQNIILVSLYQVCNQQANNVGNRTAFVQQLSLLRQNGKDCLPRKSLYDNINKQIQEEPNKSSHLPQ